MEFPDIFCTFGILLIDGMKHFVKLLFLTAFLFFSFIKNGTSQTFLNGDFEITTAGVDQINLGNAAFNGFMSNTIAFGSLIDLKPF